VSKPPKKSPVPRAAQSETDESTQIQVLEQRRDWLGLQYLHAAQLRRKRKLTDAERRFLKKFDAERNRVLSNPKAAADKGMEAVYEGIRLIKILIHERRAEGISEENDPVLYDANCAFNLAAHHVNEAIICHAEEGDLSACHAVFRDGKALAWAFSRLALAYPEQFREYTERELMIPSLRSRNPAFTCDAEAIIQAVHLGEKNHASNVHDNRTRLGALCHQFIAEYVDLLEAARLESTERETPGERWANFPALKGNARTWWKLEVKARVHREFERMRKNPLRNPGLWQELEKVTDGGTDSAKRAALEKYCYNKLEQIAGESSSVSKGI
jgi:hypothetical protein